MKLLLALSTCLLLVACAKSDDNKTSSSNEVREEMTDVTSYAECEGAATTNNLYRTWGKSLSSESFDMNVSLQIQANSVRFTNTCSLHGRSLTVSAVSGSNVIGNTISILNTAKDDKHINEPDFNLDCHVNVKPATMAYSFKGQCLVLKILETNETMTLVPRF